MKPGRELDALIATQVMGDPLPSYCSNCGDLYLYCMCSHAHPVHSPYSTEIVAAWDVVEKITSGNFEGFALTKQPGTIGASFSSLRGNGHFQSNGDTAPHAICLAALKAMGVDIP